MWLFFFFHNQQIQFSRQKKVMIPLWDACEQIFFRCVEQALCRRAVLMRTVRIAREEQASTTHHGCPHSCPGRTPDSLTEGDDWPHNLYYGTAWSQVPSSQTLVTATLSFPMAVHQSEFWQSSLENTVSTGKLGGGTTQNCRAIFVLSPIQDFKTKQNDQQE